MRPPVTIPLEEMMIEGDAAALIFLDSSGVDAKVKPGQFSGDPCC